MRLFIAMGVVFAACFSGQAKGDDPVVTSEFIYEEATFPSAHASTIVQTTDGTLVAAWFGGTAEKHKDVGIWVSRREGGRWSMPVEAVNGAQFHHADGTEHRYPCWNPVLYQPHDEALLLFYKCGPSPSEWWGMVLRSNNDGKSWSFPRRLPEGIVGPIKNKPVLLSDGNLICGSSTEDDGWKVHFEITSNLGRTWTRIGPINDGKEIEAIQPSLLIHPKNRLQAIGRSRQGKLWTAWSDDHGRTWGPMTLTDLPNPNSGTDAVTLRDGRQLLVYNDTPQGRTPLTVAISKDGKEWKPVVTLEQGPGEFSYPAVIQSKDGKVHITYTWKRERIKYVALDPSKL